MKTRRGLFAILAAIAFAYASIFLLQHFYGSLVRPGRAGGQDHPVQVHAMDVVLQLHRDNRVTVAERLQVEMLDGTSHGIYRTLPLAAKPPVRRQEAPLLKVLEASIDGVPCRTDDLKALFGTQDVNVYLRDANRTLAPGIHVFRLVYEMTGIIGFGTDEDWIAWNVTGSGWDNGVLAASCTVVPAEGAPLGSRQAFLGYRNTKDSPVDLGEATLDGRTCFVYRARVPVKKHQHFTVYAGFPKGCVSEPALYRPGEDRGFTFQCAAVCVFTLALCLFLWLCWGRDPKPGPRAPLFAPPSLPRRLAGRQGAGPAARLSPAQVHYLANDCEMESPGLAALLLSLARKGRCRLSGNASAGYGIERIEPAPEAATEPLSREEEAALAALPQGPVAIGKENSAILAGMKLACLNALAEDFPKLFRDARLLRWIAFAVPLFLLAWIQLSHTQLLRCFGPAWPGYPWNAVKLIVALSVSGTLLSFLLSRQNALGRGWKWLRSAALLLASTFMIAGLFLPIPVLGDAFPWPFESILPHAAPLQRTLFFGTMLWPVLIGPLMQSKSRELASLQDQIAGLALYLKAAEAPRLNALNPPQEDLALFARLLPYACALELEEAWASRFERRLAGIGNAAAVQAGFAGGLPGAGFSAADFAGAVSSSFGISGAGGSGGAGSGAGGGGGGC